MASRRSLLFAAVAVLPIALAMVLGFAARPEEGADLQYARVKRGTVVRNSLLSGAVWPRERVSVWPNSGSKVQRLYVRKGDSVRKGRVLAELDSERAALEVKRRELRLQRALAPSSVNDIEVLEARLELQAAKRALQDLTLRAPIDGAVVFLGVREGELVGSFSNGAAPILIAKTSEMVVEAEGDEYEIAGVRQGQRALVYIPARRFGLSGVVRDAPSLSRFSPGNATFNCIVALNGEVPDAVLGMSAQVEIQVARRDDVNVVPVEALLERAGAMYVLHKTNDVLRAQRVQVGLTDTEFAEILGGVGEGALVAVGPADNLRAVFKAVR